MRTIHVFTILVPSSCFRMMKKCASCWIRSALGASQLIAYLTVGSCEPDASSEESASQTDRKSTRLNSSHITISYAVFCLKKKIETQNHATCILRSLHATTYNHDRS